MTKGVTVKLLNPKRGTVSANAATAFPQITVNSKGEPVIVRPAPVLGVGVPGGELLMPFGAEFLVAGVEPYLEEEDLATQWREAQLARQAAEEKARTVERENLSRTLYRFLLGKQADTVKN